MITLIFILLMITIFGKLVVGAIKAAWGISKVLLTLVFLPLILVVMVIVGLIKIAMPILLIVGIVTLIKSITNAKSV